MIQIAPLFDECRAARVAGNGLAVLAPLRRLPGIRIVEWGDSAWIAWEGAMPSVVRALQAARGVTFYSLDNGNWRPINAALPEFTVPNDMRSLGIAQVVVPAPLTSTEPPNFVGTRLNVTLVPCSQPRPATALRCSAEALGCWIKTATTLEIEQLKGALCGDRVWLRGERLPVLPGAERFWGKRVLCPLGMRPEPDWPESPLRFAAIVDDDETLVLTANGPEALPDSAFSPLTRASVRRAIDNKRI